MSFPCDTMSVEERRKTYGYEPTSLILDDEYAVWTRGFSCFDYGLICEGCHEMVGSRQRTKLVANSIPYTLCKECLVSWRAEQAAREPKFTEHGCSLGHTWLRPNPLNGDTNSKCPYCEHKKVLTGFNDLATLHPHLIPYLVDADASQILPTSREKHLWKCRYDHTWEDDAITIRARFTRAQRSQQGHMCAYCWNNVKNGRAPDYVSPVFESVPERNLDQLLNKAGVLDMIPRTEKNRYFNRTIRLARFSTIDMAGEHNGYKVFVEYDGEYWHRDKKTIDTAKTEGILAHDKTLVVRVRENRLFSLDIDNPRYLELNGSPNDLPQIATQISNWVKTFQ